MRTFRFIAALLLVLALVIPVFADTVDEDTAKLESLTGITAEQAQTKYKTIKKGTNNALVKSVQEKLRELGYTSEKPDGSFGAKTEAAVKTFEAEQGLVEDGVLTPLEIYYTLKCSPMTRDEVVIANAKAGDKASIAAALKAMPIRVTGAKVLVQSKLNKDTYPDMLTATLENKGSKDIVGYLISFLGYDEDGVPKQILTQYDPNGYFEIIGDASEIVLSAGGTFGASYGWRLDNNHGITYVLACLQSVTFDDGTTWENPVFEAWKETYAEQQVDPADLAA